MTKLMFERQIKAPPGVIYALLIDPQRLPEAVPDILSTEILSGPGRGPGTRFKETRKMFGREASEEMEITEATEDAHVVISSRPQGLIWESCHSLEKTEGGTRLVLEMNITPTGIAGRLMMLVMTGAIRKAIEKDLDAIAAWCESAAITE